MAERLVEVRDLHTLITAALGTHLSDGGGMVGPPVVRLMGSRWVVLSSASYRTPGNREKCFCFAIRGGTGTDSEPIKKTPRRRRFILSFSVGDVVIVVSVVVRYCSTSEISLQRRGVERRVLVVARAGSALQSRCSVYGLRSRRQERRRTRLWSGAGRFTSTCYVRVVFN